MSAPRSRTGPPDDCALCQRALPLTFHHLIPRLTHKKRWCRDRFDRDEMNRGAWLCRDCHACVHRFLTHRELAERYNTVELLLAHPDVGRFVQWASRQHRTRNRIHRPRSG